MAVPTDLVLNYRRQGYSNNQIVQILQRDGYTSDQIFDAMNQADIKGNIQPIAPMPTADQVGNPMASSRGGDDATRQRIEELAEVIIDEKWNDLVKNINRIVEWKTKIESRLDIIESNFSTLQHSFDELNKAVIGKLDGYDQNITTVSSEVQAMEKVFSKILPALTENINAMTRMTKKLSGDESKPK
ncbi:hypothetical protein J4460_01890 [Candidatus Woesearchaeota archaeon]|nr:MAG: hypothetical protein QS99_C0003G0055 [archaeon GW2011_AR4]MBS3129403.1 hypothetical protein [Candidatus Woesearchaeota archaeon]HIH38445.1 hypothetical protein [Candidatus Woesearchaeota archaeon]HIH48097.1 hypothetical protein [Candidatus Woesearchaeota archaeon]HIJ03458.1 hypothetical protein [Candidatus Woesearchaeota archaeon]